MVGKQVTSYGISTKLIIFRNGQFLHINLIMRGCLQTTLTLKWRTVTTLVTHCHLIWLKEHLQNISDDLVINHLGRLANTIEIYSSRRWMLFTNWHLTICHFYSTLVRTLVHVLRWNRNTYILLLCVKNLTDVKSRAGSLLHSSGQLLSVASTYIDSPAPFPSPYLVIIRF